MGSQTVQPAPLLRPLGSEKVHCRHKQLSWRPETEGPGTKGRERGSEKGDPESQGEGLGGERGGDSGGQEAEEKGRDGKDGKEQRGERE